MVGEGIDEQTRQVFNNILSIADAANINFSRCVKLTISMIDLSGFATVNDIMKELLIEPYPARACVQVAALPKGALIEVEAIFYSGA